MSRTSPETENEFNYVINRVWSALDAARREMSTQRTDNNMLRATRATFRGRRRGAGRREIQSGIWKVKLFLLPNADAVVLPPHKVCRKLTRVGLGIPQRDLAAGESQGSYIHLSWTLQEFNNYICQCFPSVSLNVIGFHLARADKSKILKKIEANTLSELKAAVGRSRVYIIPHANIPMPLEVSERVLLTPASSSTLQGATTTASSITISPSASTAAPSAMYVGPSQTPDPSAISPSASTVAPSAMYVGPSQTPDPSAISPPASTAAPSAMYVGPSQTPDPSAISPPASTVAPSAMYVGPSQTPDPSAISPPASTVAPSAMYVGPSQTPDPSAISPPASTVAPSAMYVGPSQTPDPSAVSPPASTVAPSAMYVGPSQTPDPSAATLLAPVVPVCMPWATTITHSNESPLLPSLGSMAPATDMDRSSSRTVLNHSLEASLDPELWLNAGTPEVFYRRAHVEPVNRTSVSEYIIDTEDEDSEDEEDTGFMGVPTEGASPQSEEVDLAVILSTFQRDHISGEEVSNICVRRKKLLESAIKAISRPTFSWKHKPYVDFVGEDADDMGGPQREFFRLLMIEVQTSLGIFEGKAGQLFFSYDQAALDQGKYFKGGNLIAWSVAHGGPCIKALDPSLFQLMCGQVPLLEQFNCSVLPDADVQSKVEKIQQCKTAEDLTALQQDLGDWIADCGVPSIFSATVEDVPKTYAYVVKHYIFLRMLKMINQFTDGINAFGEMWNLVKKNWVAFLPMFTNMQEPLSKAAFKAIFSFNYSRRGSNRREAEEDTIFSWEMVLNMIEDKLTELRFEDILVFVTGADEVPALGFPSKPSIDFYEQESGQRRLPYASTCMMCLYLPRGVTQEDELHQLLSQAIRDSLGFGKV